MPSTVERLTTRLRTEWKKYVLPEAMNEDTIVLHMFDEMWVAFERSAYFLYNSCPNASPMVGRVDGNPFPLVLCVVPKKNLKVNPRKARYKDSEFKRRTFSTSMGLADYQQWHTTKVRDYMDCDPSLWYIELRDADIVDM